MSKYTELLRRQALRRDPDGIEAAKKTKSAGLPTVAKVEPASQTQLSQAAAGKPLVSPTGTGLGNTVQQAASFSKLYPAGNIDAGLAKLGEAFLTNCYTAGLTADQIEAGIEKLAEHYDDSFIEPIRRAWAMEKQAAPWDKVIGAGTRMLGWGASAASKAKPFTQAAGRAFTAAKPYAGRAAAGGLTAGFASPMLSGSDQMFDTRAALLGTIPGAATKMRGMAGSAARNLFMRPAATSLAGGVAGSLSDMTGLTDNASQYGAMAGLGVGTPLGRRAFGRKPSTLLQQFANPKNLMPFSRQVGGATSAAGRMMGKVPGLRTVGQGVAESGAARVGRAAAETGMQRFGRRAMYGAGALGVGAAAAPAMADAATNHIMEQAMQSPQVQAQVQQMAGQQMETMAQRFGFENSDQMFSKLQPFMEQAKNGDTGAMGMLDQLGGMLDPIFNGLGGMFGNPEMGTNMPGWQKLLMAAGVLGLGGSALGGSGLGMGLSGMAMLGALAPNLMSAFGGGEQAPQAGPGTQTANQFAADPVASASNAIQTGSPAGFAAYNDVQIAGLIQKLPQWLPQIGQAEIQQLLSLPPEAQRQALAELMAGIQAGG